MVLYDGVVRFYRLAFHLPIDNPGAILAGLLLRGRNGSSAIGRTLSGRQGWRENKPRTSRGEVWR
jgi:hypothetical protein